MKDYDDKDLVILAVLLLGIGAMAIPYVSAGAFDFLDSALTGLFGVAVGRATAKG